ncbi:putative formate transporter [Fulvia fulva]|uniref:Formate transporter n=1 Tax=Passalora fulva TaxID=5499 RepID=A0A9Q8PBL6_PASFU|nr:putative formate transporter [Fulvia fulva]KAK4621973.1 putative formate transporter [Fulvia fulva]KAK4623130.1 putative formate transporter [Fulvia fulva]UJO19514.1 putative formate transporter [Fulvia fulva]WPV16107.1 putative formate transporter [Fulvia fulva]WPV30889.1 putative formate transporter [Fulvia fulva]
MAPSTGTLPPHEAAQAVLRTGLTHLAEPLVVTFTQNLYGAMCLSSGGLFSILVRAGFAGFASENNPGIQRLLQGFAFPFGIVLTYTIGAELFTGYPMWLTMAALERKGRPHQYIYGVVTSWVGNLLGALLFSALFTYSTQAISEDPWRSAIVTQITEDIVDLSWHIIFLRAFGCGWLVTIAMFLGTQNQDGISKAVCLHFPFMISATARFPHTVEYMYLASTGMMLGAPLSVGGFFWKCLLPITLGNIIGGGLFTGAYLWWTHICGQKREYEGADGNLLDDHE